MLAHPRHPRLGALRHLREFHRVAGNQHRLLHTIRARHLHQHVARRDVRVRDHIRCVIARSRRDTGGGEFASGFELGPLGRPRVDCGPDHRLEVGSPSGSRGEPRIVDPLGMADEFGDACELRFPHDLGHHVPVRSSESLADHLQALVRLRAHTQRPEVGHHIGHRDGCVQHGDVHVLALTRAVPMAECHKDPDDGE